MLSDVLLSGGVTVLCRVSPWSMLYLQLSLNHPQSPRDGHSCCFQFKPRKLRMEDTKQPIAKATELLSGECRT